MALATGNGLLMLRGVSFEVDLVEESVGVEVAGFAFGSAALTGSTLFGSAAGVSVEF
jgi:hypothetical protein